MTDEPCTLNPVAPPVLGRSECLEDATAVEPGRKIVAGVCFAQPRRIDEQGVPPPRTLSGDDEDLVVLGRDGVRILGLGVEPGLSDIFARYAQDHLFDEIDEIGIRDGANLTVEGYDFAPTFSIWTTIEECLNPPVIWERQRGWYTTAPFSEPEVFECPEGIGPVTCVNVEHEEVLLVPRWVKCGRVTFKYGLGDDFIQVLTTLHNLGLDRKDPVQVNDVQVAPRDVVAAILPDPARLGSKMIGKTCAGTWVKGTKHGKPYQVYLYQVADNASCMQKLGCQAVVAQTAFNPVIGWDLLRDVPPQVR